MLTGARLCDRAGSLAPTVNSLIDTVAEIGVPAPLGPWAIGSTTGMPEELADSGVQVHFDGGAD
jgi:hypothetical protein